jgi:hypothetical protein
MRTRIWSYRRRVEAFERSRASTGAVEQDQDAEPAE